MDPKDPGHTDPKRPTFHRPRFEPESYGKYFLIDRIAVGGMAEIFRARTYGEGGFEKDLVIKRILSHLTENEEFVQMFIEEAKLTVLLQHPNIVQVYDFGKARDHYFLAMEGPYGRDLKTIMSKLVDSRQSLPLEFASLIVHELARGLFYAHSKRDETGSPLEIVHRDVSPSNVHISWDGQVKLLDFGIAKASKSTFENTEEGVLKGKFEYMSPEQAQGEYVDHRSDIFSCGICLWEMVTGKRLFKSSTPLMTLSRIKAGEVPLVRQENPAVPKALADIIHRALAYRPEDRYQSADEMRKDIEGYLKPTTTNELNTRLSDWMQKLFVVEMEMERLLLEESRKVATALATMEDTLELDLVLEEDEEDTIEEVIQLAPDPGPPPTETRKGRGLIWAAVIAAILLVVGAISAALILPPMLRQPGPEIEPVTPQAGSLLLEILPAEASDALVTLGGEPIELPYHDLEPGVEYRLRVEKDGYIPYEETFSIVAGERYRLKAPLAPVEIEPITEMVEPVTADEPPPVVDTRPAIIWQSTPSRAWVVIDGQTRGRTPYRYEGGSPGDSVAATFKLDGYEDAGARGTFPFEGSITVRGKLNEIAAPVEPAYLTINATPWADVYVDGAAVGQTPIGNLEVTPGTHTVRLVCPPLEAEVTKTVTLAAGERKPVSADLEE